MELEPYTGKRLSPQRMRHMASQLTLPVIPTIAKPTSLPRHQQFYDKFVLQNTGGIFQDYSSQACGSQLVLALGSRFTRPATVEWLAGFPARAFHFQHNGWQSVFTPSSKRRELVLCSLLEATRLARGRTYSGTVNLARAKERDDARRHRTVAWLPPKTRRANPAPGVCTPFWGTFCSVRGMVQDSAPLLKKGWRKILPAAPSASNLT